jgi:type I restriction enzyme M protein
MAVTDKPDDSTESFENVFRKIDNVLRNDAGCSNELDYVEQSSWIIFLKYLSDLEAARETEATLEGNTYKPLFQLEYQWNSWAAPKVADGKPDYAAALAGDDLLEFVNNSLFPYLESFSASAGNPLTLGYKIGEIFSEITNKLTSGYNLREVLDLADSLRFMSNDGKHELSRLYEEKIERMGNAGRNGGEYYTPRPLIRSIIEVVDPQIGETIYDGAVGSAGFLCESYNYLTSETKELSASDVTTLQEKTFFGKEVKSLAYIIGTMNMILHGINAPNLVHTNALSQNVSEIGPKDRYDIVLANPPFGGNIRAEIRQNFPIDTGETAYLFLQHFLKSLKAGGRAGIVIKNTFLSNTDNASTELRKQLLEECNLHTVLDCPSGTFPGAGVKTVVLFFTKGEPTTKIWFYQLNPGRNLGKTEPLNDEDLAEFIELQKTSGNSENSWIVDVSDVDANTFDLSVKNPNHVEEIDDRTPTQILDEIEKLDKESAEILNRIRELL